MPATRLQIKNALQNPYDRVLFAKEVLKPVFGSGFNLLNTMIEATEKPNLSESKVIDQVKIYANIKLEDDTEITCYEIVLQPTVRIERSKVIIQRYIRKLLTSGQAALVNFITPVDNRIWRLTLIAKDSILTDDSIEERYTNAKRYTYLVGPSENCRTVAERLEILSFEKKINFDALINAFSVEKLNKAFYKDITEQFYQLIGATTGIGKNSKVYDRALILPNIVNENNRRYQEFAVRLIGRTVFCWFLKVKKSEAGISLLPEHLLSSVSVRENPNYYHNVLEKLFFQTLNTPSERRILDLPKGSEYIPFLNGGLFEAQSDDYYKFNETTSLSSNVNSLTIPDQWFIDFFEKLEQYNFTIDENSVLDVEVSVDPEMLGSIFENLLAEIDPDSGETARKATGSFYTPREVVDYMATESLVYYLHTDTKIVKDRLELIFNIEGEPNFDKREEHAILASLDKLKILDPACGSGAFPMGILQKIVLALQKLDKNGEWWIEQQVSKNSNPIAKLAVREKLQKNPDYARKIGIIQNSLYGVDIQPIAAEISKLRCFLTLIVDEHIDESKPNRGVEPLPNLEFKFVTADTLLKLPEETLQVPMYNAKKKKNPLELLDEIQQVRLDYLESFGDNKQILKEKFHDLQKEIFDQQGLFGSVENNRAYKISIWNPFSHDKTDWFDPQWMFGIKEFDIVIGNPPYIKEYTNKKAFDSIRGKSYYQGKMDLWYAFACYSLDMLSETGIQCFIAQNNWTTSSGASILRNKILKETQIKLFTDFGNYKVFKTAGIQTMVYVLQKSISDPIDMHCVKLSILNDGLLKDSNIIDFLDFKIDNSFAKKSFFELYPEKYLDKQLTFNETAVDAILNKIERLGNFKLDEKEVAQGIVFPQDFINKSTQQILGDGSKVGDGVFVLSNAEKNKLDLSPFENRLIKPLYTSHQLKEFYADPINKFWVIYTNSEFKNSASISQYPNLKTHLDKYSKIITSDNKPYGLHRARDERFFNGEKIVAQRKCPSRPSFTYTDFDCYVSATFNVIKTNRINLKYLTALLNSKLIRFWLRHKGKMQGDNYQIDKEPLLNIPIFRTSDPQILIEKTESILFKKSLTLDISQTEQKMDDIIFNLYELAEDEIKLINEEL